MSENKRTVESYMAAFRESDHAAVLACLTDDVEWEIPGFFHISGREAFDRHIEGEGFTGKPDIRVQRMTEENDVVIAEGSVRAQRTDGAAVDLVFCDVFEMRGGRIRKLISYLVMKPS